MTTPEKNAHRQEAKARKAKTTATGTSQADTADSVQAGRARAAHQDDDTRPKTGSRAGKSTRGSAKAGNGATTATKVGRSSSKAATNSDKATGKVLSSSTKSAKTQQRPATTTSTRRKTSATTPKQRANPRHQKVAQRVTPSTTDTDHFTPAWVRHTLAVVVIIVFAAAFYFLCIQPYAYRWKPCYGLKGYGVCLPSGFTVHGIDISHYQGDVDWNALTADDGRPFPLNFVFMKATEGGDHVDDRFADNFRQAREHGLIRGAYHYFLPQSDPVRQAESFIRTVSLEPGDLPPVLDVETTDHCSDQELQQAVITWMDRVERHYGVRPILYTSYKFRTRHLDTPSLDAYPYWIAHYYVDSVRYQGSWHFWQYTDVGDVPGIRPSVDLNVFRGTLQQLRDLTLPEPSSEQ